jgi:hypothetical protein
MWRTEFWKVALGAIVVGFLFGFAANRPVNETGAWFTGIAAGVAVIAIGLAYPAYRDLRARQKEYTDVQIALQVVRASSPPEEFTDTKLDELVEVADREFKVRVVIHNAGTGVYRWGVLNIQVPVPCEIKPCDVDERKAHYPSGSIGYSEEIVEGTVIPVNFTVAERDFPPIHVFLYHAEITFHSEKNEWPVAAVLDGYPGERALARAVIRVPPPEP